MPLAGSEGVSSQDRNSVPPTFACPWCGVRVELVFVSRVEDVVRHDSEHHCLIEPMVDDLMTVRFERRRR